MKRSNSPSISSPCRLLAVLAIVMLGACSSTPPAPQTSGNTGPVAYLKANNGTNNTRILGSPRSVLELHVIEGRHHVEPVAQCDQIYTGTALGGGTARELQVVLCDGDWNNDGEYWLISEAGVVSVRRVSAGNYQQTVLEYRLRDTKARAIAKRD